MAFPKRTNFKTQKRQNLIIIGSRNPVKIKSTDSAFHAAFEDSFLIQSLNVSSDVNDQPYGDLETYTGAYNRAFNAKSAFPEADYWVGIEGGVDEIGEQMVAFAWVVVMDKEEKIGKAKTATFFLPKVVQDMIKGGMELGEADDKVFNSQNSKQGSGAVGLLSNGMVNRKEYYEQAIMLSLIPFVNPTIY